MRARAAGRPLRTFSSPPLCPGPHGRSHSPKLPQRASAGKRRVNSQLLPDCAVGVGGWGACLSGSMDFCSGFTGKAVAEGGRGSPWQLLAKGTGWLLGTNSSRGPRGPGGHLVPRGLPLPPPLPLESSPFGGSTGTLPSREWPPSLPPSSAPARAAAQPQHPHPRWESRDQLPSGRLGAGGNLPPEGALPREGISPPGPGMKFREWPPRGCPPPPSQALSGKSRIPGRSRAHPAGPHREDSRLSGQFKKVLPTPSANTHHSA